MRKLRPVTFLNHPKHLAFNILSPKADRVIVTTRAYTQLVTRHGVSPERAKRLLGLPQ